MDYETFSEWVRAFRIDGLHETQDQMGTWLGVHAFTVGRWERGLARPHSSSLHALIDRAAEVGFIQPPSDVDRRLGPRP